jgi:hypothetical protein
MEELMTDKTVLVLGAVGVGAILLLFLSKKSQQNLAQQQLVLSGQYANTTAGQVGGILSSVGSFFNSGALQSLKDSFLNTGDNNQPGLIPTPSSSPALNEPGLNAPSVWGANYGPQNEPGVTTGPMPEEYYA